MPFFIKVLLYKLIAFTLGVVGKVLPLPKPLLYTGSHSSLQLCDNVIYFGYKSVIIVTDAVLHQMGLLEAVKSKLTSAGIDVCVYDGVEPNPTFVQVHAGLELAKANRCDAVLAFGGGSSIDAAKVIAVAATNRKSPEAMVGFFKVKQPGLPLYAIPTTAGTGSEVSLAAVISDPTSHAKGVIADPKTVPVAAALDPQIMLGLPPAITAATGMDALTHAIEAYSSTIASAESDAYALAAVKLIFEYLPVAYSNGADVTARDAMALASCYAAMAFNKAGLGYVHGIAHQLSAHYNTPHGIANAVVLPKVLDFQQQACQQKYAQLAAVCGGVDDSASTANRSQQFIAAVRQLSADLNIPTCLEALQADDVGAIAKAALKEAHYSYAVPKYMNQQQCEVLVRKLLS